MEPHPYRQAFTERDLDRLIALLADDVVFWSPVISGPGFVGRDSVAAVLAIALDAITDVEFTHEFGDERAHVLVADGRALGKPFEATTLLEFDADGKIRRISEMARPLVGLVAIAEAIGSQLAEREKPGRSRVVRVLSKPLAGLAAVLNLRGSRMIGALNRSTAETVQADHAELAGTVGRRGRWA